MICKTQGTSYQLYGGSAVIETGHFHEENCVWKAPFADLTLAVILE